MTYTGQPDFVKKSGINYFQKVFYYLYILVACICYSPFDLLGYLSPFIFLVGLFLIWPSDQMFRRLLACLLIAGIIISFYGIIYPHLILQNALLTLITYASYISIIVIPSRMLVSEILIHKILAFNQKLLLLEGVIGIIQGFYGFLKYKTFNGGVGDGVEGTIDIALDPEFGLSNVTFAINTSFLCLLAVVAIVKFRYSPYPLIVGVLSLVLASVVHVLIFLISAVLIIAFINFAHLLKNPKVVIIFLFSIVLSVSVTFYFIGGNIVDGFSYYAIGRTYNPKEIIRKEALFVIPKEYPAMPFIGLGPGQFTSRASLIGSGRYLAGGSFNNPKSFLVLTPKNSAPMEKFVMPIWSNIAYAGEVFGVAYGSSDNPFYSWISIYSEFGLVGSFIVISSFASFLIKAIILRKNHHKFLYAIVFQVGVIFLFLLGYQDNYWEVAQVVFVGLILLKLLYANTFYSDIGIRTPHG